MKVVILAGGLGTRLSEETKAIPKPMVEIGGKPIIWHIMKIYSEYGFNEFIICLGYKGYRLKEYFANYFLHNGDFTVDLSNNQFKFHEKNHKEDWKITLVDTGIDTMTGGRIKRVKDYIGDETFMLTYGDGVGNVNIKELVEFHKKHGKLATLTTVQPEGRFGALKLDNHQVTAFAEKLDNKESWINAGFFVLDPKIIDYIDDDTSIFEQEPLKKLSNEGELMAHYHKGFWKPMDKLSDKLDLEKLWQTKAPWKIWK